MEEKIYAPVIIPTLCRYEHLVRCVESLRKCTGASETDLYIGLDYPANQKHWDGYNKICEYLPTVTGFKNLFIIKREENFGVLRNPRDLIARVKEKYDRYIFSEDDNEFAPNFLEYMNHGLNTYKDDTNVIAICGFADPFVSYDCMKDYQYNHYPMIGYNAWGVGIWFDKKPVLIPCDDILFSTRLFFKAYRLKEGMALHRMFARRRRHATNDLEWRVYCALNHKYCIFPSVSKVRNWGFDGSGHNCSSLKKYSKQVIDTSTTFCDDKVEIKPYPQVLELQNRLYDLPLFNKLVLILEYILFRATKGKMCLRDISFIRKIMVGKIEKLNQEDNN